LVLQLPEPVALLDDLGFTHQEVELLEVTVGRVVPPGLLYHHCSHRRSSWALELLLGIPNDRQDLSLVGDCRNELIFCVTVLVEFCKLQKSFRGDVCILDDELAQELFQLRDELGDGAPLGNILSFEAKEFFSVLLHDSLLYEKLWVVDKDLRPACTSRASIDALHVIKGICLSLLVNNILLHRAVHSNLVAWALGIEVLSSSSW